MAGNKNVPNKEMITNKNSTEKFKIYKKKTNELDSHRWMFRKSGSVGVGHLLSNQFHSQMYNLFSSNEAREIERETNCTLAQFPLRLTNESDFYFGIGSYVVKINFNAISIYTDAYFSFSTGISFNKSFYAWRLTVCRHLRKSKLRIK